MHKHCPRCGSRLKPKRIEQRRRFICPECHWVEYRNPLPSAAALVRNKKDDVLLVKRGVEPGKGSRIFSFE